MASSVRICCCEVMGADVQAVLAGNGGAAAGCSTFASRCGRPPLTWDEVRPLCGTEPAVLLGGECLARLGPPPDDLRRVSLLRRSHCTALLCGDYAMEQLAAAGAYLVTPGWVDRWQSFISGWGFDRRTGAEFFAESCRKIALLDTGSSSTARGQLQAFGEFVARPVEVAAVGLELLSLQLERALLDLEPAATTPVPDSDHAMLLDMFSTISTAHGEQRVIQEILDFFARLFGASRVVFVPAGNDEPLLYSGPVESDEQQLRAQAQRLQGEYLLLGEPHGFLVRLCHDGALGCLLIGGFATPQQVDRYLNIAIMAANVCALAISSARKVQLNLKESEEKYRLLFEHMANGFALLESVPGPLGDPADYRLIEANPAFRTLLGGKRGELPGRTLLEIFPHLQPGLLEALGELARHGTPVALERYSISLEKHCQVWLFRPRPGYAAMIVNDITQQKLLEEKLRQSIKMESVGRLAGGVAHDFNNMLSVIIGYAELLNLEFQDDPRITVSLREICKAAEHSRDITAQLLTFSRQQLISPKTIDASDALRDMEKRLQQLCGPASELHLEYGPNLWKVKIDPAQLEQIVTSLVRNAASAMPQGGRLFIATRNCPVDEAACRDNLDAAPGDYVQLTIVDSGHGMDQETCRHIFEPFFTTKGVGQGSGLGLATVYGIVTQNAGFITVASEVGVGSTFRIHLPRFQDRVPEPKEVELVPGAGTVLLIEDDEIVAKMIERMLNHMGYAVLLAENPARAIEICWKPEQQVDLVLSDVVLPGIGGKQAVDRILERHPGAAVLFMSGYARDTVLEKGVDTQGRNFLRKPFGMSDLHEKIKEVLGEARQLPL